METMTDNSRSILSRGVFSATDMWRNVKCLCQWEKKSMLLRGELDVEGTRRTWWTPTKYHEMNGKSNWITIPMHFEKSKGISIDFVSAQQGSS